MTQPSKRAKAFRALVRLLGDGTDRSPVVGPMELDEVPLGIHVVDGLRRRVHVSLCCLEAPVTRSILVIGLSAGSRSPGERK